MTYIDSELLVLVYGLCLSSILTHKYVVYAK